MAGYRPSRGTIQASRRPSPCRGPSAPTGGVSARRPLPADRAPDGPHGGRPAAGRRLGPVARCPHGRVSGRWADSGRTRRAPCGLVQRPCRGLEGPRRRPFAGGGPRPHRASGRWQRRHPAAREGLSATGPAHGPRQPGGAGGGLPGRVQRPSQGAEAQCPYGSVSGRWPDSGGPLGALRPHRASGRWPGLRWPSAAREGLSAAGPIHGPRRPRGGASGGCCGRTAVVPGCGRVGQGPGGPPQRASGRLADGGGTRQSARGCRSLERPVPSAGGWAGPWGWRAPPPRGRGSGRWSGALAPRGAVRVGACGQALADGGGTRESARGCRSLERPVPSAGG